MTSDCGDGLLESAVAEGDLIESLHQMAAAWRHRPSNWPDFTGVQLHGPTSSLHASPLNMRDEMSKSLYNRCPNMQVVLFIINQRCSIDLESVI